MFSLALSVHHWNLTMCVSISSHRIPLTCQQIFTGRTAEQTNTRCSLTDPYIGQDAGFVQVTPLLGTLPPLVVIPVKASPLEGWRNLDEPSTEASYWYGSQTFEGLFEWLFHTRAYAENEWTATTPWNEPTSHTLLPGQTRTYGLQCEYDEGSCFARTRTDRRTTEAESDRYEGAMLR